MITEEEFIREIKFFHSISEQLNDQWQLHKPDKNVFYQTPWLSKKYLIKHKSESPIEQTVDSLSTHDTSEATAPATEYINGDYQIVYSHIYQVPVLFFNLSRPNGVKLRLEEVWELNKDTIGTSDKWSFITEDEQPILRIPYFCLHPCHTGRFMETILQPGRAEGEAAASYLLMWISIVSSVMRLDIPVTQYCSYYKK